MPARGQRSPGGQQAVIYLRQSTYREESVSLEQQASACEDYCRRRGYSIVEVISDPGLSGRKWDKRPGVQRAMQLLDDHAADVIVCWKWSRISRRRLDFEVAMDRAENVSGRIESATEPIDVTTASGKFARGMLAEVAAFESARIGEDWRATHRRRREKGVPPQGGKKFGYDRVRDDETGRVVGYRINEEQAAVLRWMYAQVLAGHGAPYIARELNKRGVKNPVGRTWPQVGVYALLDSGFPAGLIVWRDRDGVNRPKGDRVYFAGLHEPIIDRETWQQYLATRRRSSYRPSRHVDSPYPLSGLVFCGDCAAPMWPTSGSRSGTGLGLVCSRWQSRGEGRCVTAVTRRVEDEVREWLRQWVDQVELQADAQATVHARIATARRDEKAARAKVTAAEQKLAKLNRGWIEGMIPDEGYRQTRDQYLGELEVAKRDIESAQDEVLLRRAPSRQEAVTVVDEWDELPATTRRNVVAALIERVIVHPPVKRYHRGRVEIVSKLEN